VHRVARQRQVGADVGDQEAFDQRHPGEADAGQLANRTVRAVAPHDPAVVIQVGDLGAPLDVAAELGQSPAQPLLDDGLRHQCARPLDQRRRAADPQARDLCAVHVDHDLTDLQAEVGQVAQRPEPLHHVQAARLQPQRP
jgi:hypothetical protein